MTEIYRVLCVLLVNVCVYVCIKVLLMLLFHSFQVIQTVEKKWKIILKKMISMFIL